MVVNHVNLYHRAIQKKRKICMKNTLKWHWLGFQSNPTFKKIPVETPEGGSISIAYCLQNFFFLRQISKIHNNFPDLIYFGMYK